MTALTWLGRAAALVAGWLTAVLLGTAAVLLVAARSSRPVVFVTAGTVVALAAWLGVQRLLRRFPGLASRAVAWIGALAVAATFGAVLIPLRAPVVAPEAPPGAGTWPLADGGSLSFGVVRATAERPGVTPIVVLHGGPGYPDTAGLLEAFGPLSTLGHDVWAYDQRGTGRSSRLADPTGYTTARAVADLEAVRRNIGSERVILIGHSYGAYLAAAYTAGHPDRVERAVMLSPGDLDPQRAAGNPQDRLTAAQRWNVYRPLLLPRALLTYSLVQVNPSAAHAFAGDREVDAYQDRIYAAALPGLHCPGDTGPELHGAGFYANAVFGSRRAPTEDNAARPRPPRVPVLVIKGQCDYLDWQSATGYLTASPDSQLLYLPGAGHDVHIDEPERVREAVAAFLTGRPVRDALEDPMRQPEDYQP